MVKWPAFETVFPPGSPEWAWLDRLDPGRLPRHVAVIMDGNGRWAEARGLTRIEGHRAGTEAVRQVIETSARLGISFLTLYAFSVENWKRPRAEVDELMQLLRKYLQEDLPTLLKHRIRFRAIGRLAELDRQTRLLIDHTTRRTAGGDGLTLNIALNYGGRTELVDAVRAIAGEVARRRLAPVDIDESRIAGHLYAPDTPDPDLLIRTSGEYRLSNFLLWQAAYTEFHFCSRHWPDFQAADLFQALDVYQGRSRRFGGLGHPSPC